jgi:membrane protease YdiL (CAAX protease family)
MSDYARRLMGIAVVLGGAILLMNLVPQRADVSGTRWYAAAAERPMFADCTYRLSVFLQDLSDRHRLHEDGPIRDLQERAVAQYERLALGRPQPDALAAQRLGAVYAQRGYFDEAKDMFALAAQYDDARAEVYLADATVCDPAQQDMAHVRSQLLALNAQEPWLRGMILPHYYERLGDRNTAAAAEQQWHEEQTRFGRGLVVVFGIYVLLLLTGISVIGYGFIRTLTRATPAPPRPPLLAGWQPMDVAEIMAATFALTVALASAIEALLSVRSFAELSAFSDAIVAFVSYTAFVTLALMLAWKRIPIGPVSWLAQLGLRRERVLAGLLAGAKGYGVLVALFALGVWLFGGNPVSQLGAREITGDLLRGLRQPGTAIIFFLLLCVVTPVLEELIFRGFAYAGLRRRFTPAGAAVISAAVFTAIHVDAPAFGQLILFAIGILLANLYERERTLWPCIAAHAIHNTLFFVVTALQAW